MTEISGITEQRGIIQSTINSKDKKLRVDRFEDVWKKGWDPRANYGYGYFQTEKSDSPFSQYSSKGWKIHIAFEKGREKEMAKSLFVNGLYFKLEGMGSYFNGKKASGATIYIGSYDNMEAIAEHLERYVGYFLAEGSTQQGMNGLKIQSGSGSDIEIRPKITARFDAAKTKHGIYGDKKYNEDGIASWTGLGGIPLLAPRVEEARKIEDNLEYNWNKLTPEQRNVHLQKLKSIYEESKMELIKDFGQEFVLGSKKTS